MAISTYKVFLMHKTGPEMGTYEKLCDIKTYPDLGGAPEMLETTTLSDSMQTFIAGIQSMEDMQFDANYDKDVFKTLKALEGKKESYAVYFGGSESLGNVTPDGKEGKFEFEGELSVYVTGGGVNEVVGMTITIAPSTIIKNTTA